MRLLRGVTVSLALMGACLSATAFSAATAAADVFPLRVPQVVFGSASLQGYLNGVGESINVDNEQLDAQVWTTAVSGNSTFTLMIELAGFAATNTIGIYNTNAGANPPLYQVFPGAASAGWFATAHFGNGNLVVTLFDNNSVIQGQSFYAGVDPNAFGFYLRGDGGLFYSEDSRNGGVAQMLTYAGTGQNFGEWWECFEDLSRAGQPAGFGDFDDAVLLMQSVVPTDAAGATWGRLKTLYR